MCVARGASFTNGMAPSGGPFSNTVFNSCMIKAACGLSRDASDASVHIANTNYANSVEFSW